MVLHSHPLCMFDAKLLFCFSFGRFFLRHFFSSSYFSVRTYVRGTFMEIGCERWGQLEVVTIMWATGTLSSSPPKWTTFYTHDFICIWFFFVLLSLSSLLQLYSACDFSPSPSIFFFLSVYLLACLVLVMFLNQSQNDISKHSFDTQAIYFSINAIPIRGRENCWQGKRLRTHTHTPARKLLITTAEAAVATTTTTSSKKQHENEIKINYYIELLAWELTFVLWVCIKNRMGQANMMLGSKLNWNFNWLHALYTRMSWFSMNSCSYIIITHVLCIGTESMCVCVWVLIDLAG